MLLPCSKQYFCDVHQYVCSHSGEQVPPIAVSKMAKKKRRSSAICVCEAAMRFGGKGSMVSVAIATVRALNPMPHSWLQADGSRLSVLKPGSVADYDMLLPCSKQYFCYVY